MHVIWYLSSRDTVKTDQYHKVLKNNQNYFSQFLGSLVPKTRYWQDCTPKTYCGNSSKMLPSFWWFAVRTIHDFPSPILISLLHLHLVYSWFYIYEYSLLLWDQSHWIRLHSSWIRRHLDLTDSQKTLF